MGCLVSQGFIPPCQLEDAEGGRFCEAVAAEDSEVATEVRQPFSACYCGFRKNKLGSSG